MSSEAPFARPRDDHTTPKGLALIAEAPVPVLIGLAATIAVLGMGWLLGVAGVHTLGAMGPEYERLGQLEVFNVHVISGLLQPLALVTQLSTRFKRRYPTAWIVGAVLNWFLLLSCSITGMIVSMFHSSLAVRIGLYWSGALLLLIWAFITYYFIVGRWFFYRLWVVRSSVGLILQVPFRVFLALIFALTGDDLLAAIAGYWSALILSFALVEWVFLPMVWRPKRNVTREHFTPGHVIIAEGEVGRAMYVLDSGQVRITRKVGKIVQELAVLESGSWFGEMALINDEPCNATITAVDDVWVTSVDRDGFEHLFGALPPLRQAILDSVTERRANRERLTQSLPMMQGMDLPQPSTDTD